MAHSPYPLSDNIAHQQQVYSLGMIYDSTSSSQFLHLCES